MSFLKFDFKRKLEASLKPCGGIRRCDKLSELSIILAPDDMENDKQKLIDALREEFLQAEKMIQFHEGELVLFRRKSATYKETLRFLEGKNGELNDKSIPDHVEEILGNGPLPVREIVEELAKRNIHSNVRNITGALSRYVRSGKRFSRPAPATFGLLNVGKR